jgi:hypothetical protein
MELLADAASSDDTHGTPQLGHVGAHCSGMRWQGMHVQLIEVCYHIRAQFVSCQRCVQCRLKVRCNAMQLFV